MEYYKSLFAVSLFVVLTMKLSEGCRAASSHPPKRNVEYDDYGFKPAILKDFNVPREIVEYSLKSFETAFKRWQRNDGTQIARYLQTAMENQFGGSWQSIVYDSHVQNGAALFSGRTYEIWMYVDSSYIAIVFQ